MKKSRLVVNKRREQMVKYLEFNGSFSISVLSEHFNVSSITIRRDIDYLIDNSIIERKNGQYILSKNNVPTLFTSNLSYNKHLIAEEAAKYVKDEDTIFINSSSTALLMLNYIKASNVTVITNNLRCIFHNPKNSAQVVLTGGEILSPKECLVGEYAIANLAKTRAQKCFLGCSGFDYKGGYTTAVLQEVAVNKMMIDHTSGVKYILADKDKVGKIHSFKTCDAEEIDFLITDDQASYEEVNKLNKKGVQVIQVELTKKLT
jgi:DeoR/GlpR family transcriptional regulator of sugar metabolism